MDIERADLPWQPIFKSILFNISIVYKVKANMASKVEQ